MLRTLNLPHGPWKTLLTGLWSDREVSYHENPEKELMVMIYDRRGEALRGMVFFMVKLFTLEGKAGTFIDAVGENTIVIQKNTSTFKGTFLAVATSPEYVKFSPRELIDASERHYSELIQRSADARKKSGDFEVKLVDARYAALEKTNELFGEPLALPSLAVRKEGPGLVSTQPTGRAHLGMALDGSRAEEPIRSLILTAVYGPDIVQALHVLVEGCVVNGVSAVVFDGFERAEVPNPKTDDYAKYGVEADPMGMPVRKFRPGTDYFIELQLLNTELFGDATGAGHGKEVELIGEVLEKKPSSLKEVAEGLASVKGEENKYFAARAIRICRLLDLAYPGLFSGKLEPKEIVAPWLKKMGRIAVVDCTGLKPALRKGIVYCTIKTLYESYRHEFAGGNIKALVLLSGEYASAKASHLDRELNAMVKMAGEYGIGVCVGARNEADIDPELLQNATMRIQAMEGNSASVKEHTKRAYRVLLRPTLSAV